AAPEKQYKLADLSPAAPQNRTTSVTLALLQCKNSTNWLILAPTAPQNRTNSVSLALLHHKNRTS
ncbi:hypothetical protein WAE56_16290, partial [Iodobacter sp. LRB]|uniref:hypothetical protein n=1 Tax=Iodobacter sp. LRB TaxID=3127955 RepID=UPI00307D2154